MPIGTSRHPILCRWLLWIDGGGGALVGVLVLGLRRWLAGWYGLPLDVVTLLGAANLAYGLYGLNLARLEVRPRPLLLGLVAANGAWPVVCGALLVRYGGEATGLGVLHLVAEGVYVGGLAALEWRVIEGLRLRRRLRP